VCLISCTFYAANRWCLPVTLKGPFLRNHFDDLLLIPAALPLILWLLKSLDRDCSPMRRAIFGTWSPMLPAPPSLPFSGVLDEL
jgi:hypothetical protein